MTDRNYNSKYPEQLEMFPGNLPLPGEMVREFKTKMGMVVDEYPPGMDTVELNFSLIEEELEELTEEFFGKQKGEVALDKRQIAKELADLLYVTYGFAVALGIDIDRAFKEVHESNMSKLGADGKPVYREDGKVMKGPNYTPPQLNWISK